MITRGLGYVRGQKIKTMIDTRLRVARCVVLAALTLIAVLPAAAAETARQLDSIGVSALPGNRVQIKMTMSGSRAAPKPLSFTIDNPARIAFDFPETSSNVPKTQTIGVGVARTVNAVEARGRTRVVLNLDKMVPYETRVEDNTIYVILDSPTVEASSVMPSELTPTASSGVSRQAGEAEYAITNIDFHRGKHGEGRVIVRLSDPATPVNVREVGGQIILDFSDASLPEDLQRRMNVVDFATPVALVDSFVQNGNVRVVVDTEGAFEHLAYQSDKLFTLEVKPITPEEQEARKEREYTGDRLSLNFQDIEIRAVLQLIADFTGMNMVTSDAVKGNVTLRLKNVPWDHALDIILKTKGLAMRQTGNVIMVAPAEEIAAREKQEFESQKQMDELAPLYSDLIQVNYAKAEDIAALLKAEQNSMLSERGNVTVDERTNALLVRDTNEKLVDIRKLITKLDIPVRQVLIESRIVIANDDFSRDLGVRFGTSYAAEHDTNGVIAMSGSLNGTDTMVNTAPVPVNYPSLNNRLNVNLPLAGPAGQIAFAVLGSDYLVDLELSAMQAEGRGEVVSSPRVITSNQNEATIEQGVEIPYLTASSSGATTVSFKKAVLGLTVKPQVTPDDRIIMDLGVSKDSVGQVFAGVPSVDTREVATQVLVNNGETVVLGGIYEQERSHEVEKVPFFGDIPFVGVLFRQKRNVDSKNELLIFVTPKILKESLSMR